MPRLAALLGLIVCCSPALAQDGPDNGRDAKVRRYLEVSGRTHVAGFLLDATLEELTQIPAIPPGFADALREAATEEALIARLIPLYAQLDDVTLDAAIAFYETEAGQRLAAVQGELDAASQRAASEWMQEAAQVAMQKLGLPTAEENLEQARIAGNEAAALGAMRVVMTAQSLFREGDKDGNEQFDYAHNLAQLGKVELIDEVLASGEKQGYRFELCAGSKAPEFLWMLVAHPIEPGTTGNRWFVTNQSGVVYYSTEGPFELDRVTCEIPEGATPVGR